MKRFRMIDDALYEQIIEALRFAAEDPETLASAECKDVYDALRARFASSEGGGSTIQDAPTAHRPVE